MVTDQMTRTHDRVTASIVVRSCPRILTGRGGVVQNDVDRFKVGYRSDMYCMYGSLARFLVYVEIRRILAYPM